MRLNWLGTLALACGALALPAAAQSVALKAGTIHLVEGGQILHDATILVRDGKIAAIGNDVTVPAGTRVVDYGAGAVIVPGLVAAYTPYTFGGDRWGQPGRTAAPEVRAVDGFDFYGKHVSALTGGVTTAYLSPPEGRLLAGQGAVVKMGDGSRGERVLRAVAALQGAIDASARNTPGYWQPPLPATVDTGMDYQRPQLPRTTMGAIVALEELLALAEGGTEEGPYGPYAGPELAELMKAGTQWRIVAQNAPEIRALLEFATAHSLPLVVDGAVEAQELGPALAKAGASVVYRAPYVPNNGAQNLGKGRDARWRRFDVPAALVTAGVPVAIASSVPRDLLFVAGLASQGGLSQADALRAITLTPAQILGVADRVGSLRVGKDADFAVLGGEPLSTGAGVLATWVGGKAAWEASRSGPAASAKAEAKHRVNRSVVLSVDELYLGDGQVLRPGEVAIQDGRIVEVGERVSRPAGAFVARGAAAMPGIIDALGHLGLEGSNNVPSTDFSLASIVSAGDRVDRRVALAGVTTVALAPRSASKSGAPVMAYKPAASEAERQIVGDPVALHVAWTESNRLKSGEDVRTLLAKAKEYHDAWVEYEQELAAWTPPAPKVADEKEEEADDDKASADEEKESDGDEEKDKKKKKKGEEELEPDPVTGVWSAEGLRLRLHLVPEAGSGDVEGNLRSAGVSDSLVELKGSWDREAKSFTARGLGSRGWVSVEAKLEEGKLTGKASADGAEVEFAAERTSKEWVVARRSDRLPEPAPEEERIKGAPKEPRRDAKLEPVVAAMRGEKSIIVDVSRADEILACVAAFETYGIRPVLYGAEEAWKVADQLVGRVRGILPAARVVVRDPKLGTDERRPFRDLQLAGIPVAFHSAAEEGAADLPLIAAYAVANGMSASGALRALTSDAAHMLSAGDRVGRLAAGLDGDVLLLDGPPLAPGTSVLRVWVNGEEIVEE